MKRIISLVSNDISTDNRVHKICLSLTKNGYHVLLIGRQLPWSLPLSSRLYRVKRIKLIWKKGPFFYISLNLRYFFFLLFTKYDIVLANDLDTLPAAWLATILRMKLLVFDSHELFSEVPELVDRPHIQKIWRRLENFLIPKIDAGFTVSPAIAEYYKKRFNINFELIRNAAIFKLTPECKYGNPFGNANIVLLYQGALNVGRGIELAIQSLEYIDNAILWIIGSGDIENELKLLVYDLGFQERVIFKGKVPFEELGKITERADIGFSLEEDLGLNYRFSLPNKLFDYIQARVPVIVSDLLVMRSIVENYKIGRILNVRSPFELAKIINELRNQSEFIKNFSANIELAAKELCWENEEEKLIKLIRQLRPSRI